MAKTGSVSRSEFLNRVSERAGAHKRDVEHVWEHALAVIQDSIRKGEAVSITGFGKFKQRVTKAKPARTGVDPFSGETKKFSAVPAKKLPKFLPAKAFKEYVAGKGKLNLNTRPMALATDGGSKGAAKKAAPKKAAKKTAKKAAPKKAARKPAKKAAKKRR